MKARYSAGTALKGALMAFMPTWGEDERRSRPGGRWQIVPVPSGDEEAGAIVQSALCLYDSCSENGSHIQRIPRR